MANETVIKGGTVLRRHRRARACAPTSASPAVASPRSAPTSTAIACSTPAAASSRPASSTSTRTTTRRCSGTPRSRRRASTASPPSSPATAGSRSRRRRPEHHELIARTLENVEDMDVDVARAPASRGTSRRFPEYLASVERRGIGINFAAYIGHTALRLYVMGDDGVRAHRHARRDRRDAARACARRWTPAPPASPPASPSPHRGVDGKPVPEPLRRPRRVRGAARRRCATSAGAWSPSRRASSARSTTSTTCSAKLGVPFTWTALLTSPHGDHRQALDANARAGRAGGEVWPQVTPRPLTFSCHPVEPFTLQHQPRVRRAAWRGRSRSARAAYADPAWRAAMTGASSERQAASVPLGHLRVRRERGPSRARRTASSPTSPPSAAPTRSTCLLDLALDEPDLEPAGARDHRQRRRGRRRPTCSSTSTARSASPTPARTSASCATRRRPPTCSATGCATRASCRSSTPSASSPAARPTSSASPDRGVPARGRARRRRGVRPRHRRPRPGPAGARLPGQRRAPHRRPARRHAPRARERHADPGRRRRHRRRQRRTRWCGRQLVRERRHSASDPSSSRRRSTAPTPTLPARPTRSPRTALGVLRRRRRGGAQPRRHVRYR